MARAETGGAGRNPSRVDYIFFLERISTNTVWLFDLWNDQIVTKLLFAEGAAIA